MDNEQQFPDPSQAFAAQAEALKRRRALAQQLIAQGMSQDIGQGYQGGKVFIVGNPWGKIASAIGGEFIGNQADKEQSTLEASQRQQEQTLMDAIAQAPDPQQRQQAMLRAAQQAPSLRDAIKMQMDMDKQEADRVEKGEQLAADRVEKEANAKAQREFLEQQGELNRQNRLDVRNAPTVIVHSGGAGNASTPFAGPATQAGIDPRDEMPVYRVSKTGELFKYGENGPVAHVGAVAPKPAAAKEPTESERSSAGYLGRMEAAEKNLADAKPLPYLQQRGLEKAPGLTNYTLNAKQQVTRQQQEDWVRAKLRKESGAVIGDEEMAREIRTYFPQAGDGPDVIKQKAQSRAQALEQMRSSAGRAKPKEASPVKPTAPAAPSRLKFNPQTGRVE